MQKELKLLLEHVSNITKINKEGFVCYAGNIDQHDIIIAKCGIGKVNSALRTYQLISEYRPDLIINSGVAGSVDKNVEIGTVLIADRVAYHDVWCGPETVYGQADGCPLYYRPYEKGLNIAADSFIDSKFEIKYGLICSGDKFITSSEEVDKIKSDFPDALGCDMESASIAQTCYKSGVPFMVIRVMSDMPGSGNNIDQYKNFWDEAPELTFKTVKQLIGRL